MFDRRNTRPGRRAAVLIVLVVFAASAWVWTARQLGSATSSNCQQIELLKASIRATLIQSEKTLGHPGTAGYEYYRAHPVELRAALHADQAAIQNFAPHIC